MKRLDPRVAFVIPLTLPVGLFSEARGQDRVADTVHNLSASGPGQVRAISEQQVCVFCHAPHNTSGVRPLWNRQYPMTNYTIYQSSTLDAQPGQPTGSSKQCLSCHDGTIALGSVLSRADRIRMVGGDFLPAGMTNLGTDLSDDHPISFHYTSGVAASDRQLADPAALSMEVRLDATGQLQCTSCHDPHHNIHGDFLVIPNEFGALCMECHSLDGWSECAHRTSSAPVGGSTLADWPYATVAENACRGCHRPHTAGGRERLLIFEQEEDNCLNCHDGQVAATNIVAEIDKFSAHDPRRYHNVHDPAEAPLVSETHVECADCHNPHAVAPQPPTGGQYIPISETMQMVRGATLGVYAEFEYQVCYRCHSDTAVSISNAIVRQAHTSNLRLKFDSGNPSFHPVVVSSPSSDTVSLKPGMARGSMIRCTDCHNSDTGPGGGGGMGPSGPHGSAFAYLLERNYTVTDDTIESEYEYALCYKCHRRASILGDESFPHHGKHIVEENAPCSACHDPHGVSLAVATSSDPTHLINFDVTIVQPDLALRRVEFRDLGRFAGSCTLVCHGAQHNNLTYGQ